MIDRDPSGPNRLGSSDNDDVACGSPPKDIPGWLPDLIRYVGMAREVFAAVEHAFCDSPTCAVPLRGA